MDTDDACAHTHKIIERMRSQSISPMGGTGKAFSLKTKETEEESKDNTLEVTDSDKTVIERSATSERPLPLKEMKSTTEPH